MRDDLQQLLTDEECEEMNEIYPDFLEGAYDEKI